MQIFTGPSYITTCLGVYEGYECGAKTIQQIEHLEIMEINIWDFLHDSWFNESWELEFLNLTKGERKKRFKYYAFFH